MNHLSLPSIFAVLILCLCSSSASAWSEGGHNIIGCLAYQMLSDADKQIVVELLKAHPQYDLEFRAPAQVESSDDVRLWMAGRSGYWPDVARKYDEFNRPTWHYQLGSSLVLGNVSSISVPSTPIDLPTEATLATQELHIGQAIELNKRVLASPDTPAADKALAICWLAHLVGDSHQPCHAGSLYAEKIFPEGDRGANSIKTEQSRNMHALWDQLLGRGSDFNEIRRRMVEISTDKELIAIVDQASKADGYLEPETWLRESRQLAIRYVYTPEVLKLVIDSQVSGQLSTMSLSEEYLKQAGRIAQQRALLASKRLAGVWSNALVGGKTDQ
jgi:hypothetical protein